MSQKAIEILAPAGSVEALDAAVGEGADAVYLGLKNFNARLRTTNFAWSQFEAAVRSLHRMKRKLYVTVNTVFEQREADRMYQFLKYLAAVGPDGIIVQDFGVARMVREYVPSLKLHASTQMNVASAKGVNLLSRYGFSRVVLSRELDLAEIQSIRANSASELEVFVHGALCVSCSGLCLFSSYLGGKSANRGMCTQACRRRYRIGKVDDDGSADIPGISSRDDGCDDDAFGGDDKSGYFFSPADLQLIDRVPDLADSGVSSLKIEGRMKSAEYVGIVVSAYRHLVDNLDGDRERAVAEARAILRNDFARAKTTFHYDGAGPTAWLDPKQAGGTGIPLGVVKKVKGSGAETRVLVAGDDVPVPVVGDSARFHRADDSDRKSHKLTIAERDASGGVWISAPEGFGLGDSVYLIQTKSMSRRYPRVLPNDLGTFRRMPGRESAPALPARKVSKDSFDGFPDGVYVAVGSIEDLYIVQSMRPIRAILHYSNAVAARLLESGAAPLPFNKGELIISLDPFFPQQEDERLTENVAALMAAGYRNFMLNNLGHIALFRGTDARVTAGPYLYTFNRYAYDFINEAGLAAVVTPLENNRQNLERTVDTAVRKSAFVTVFGYPALFRIRANLSDVYDFSEFSDGRGEGFRLVATARRSDGGAIRDANRDAAESLVVPEQAFSIVDKVPFLKEAGFGKFIADFNGPPLKKRDYKDVMTAIKLGTPLPNTSRFNWKDGFYSPPEGEGPQKNAAPRRSEPGSGARKRGGPTRG